jgi:acetoin utilization deacetylase AcuC-like enzyme
VVAALDRASREVVGFDDRTTPDTVDLDRVRRVHDPDYVDFLAGFWDAWTTSGRTGDAIPTMFPVRGLHQDRIPDEPEGRLGYFALAAETAITAGTWRAASASAAIAQTAQRLVAGGEPVAFGLCRPPGHHASADQFGGYCFLNNAAITAEGFLVDGAERVAVLDIDFHHGNGTQSIFWERSDVLFASLHGHPSDAFPHFLGYADEVGTGAGEGFTRNYPMRPGTAFDQWSAALDDACVHVATHRPDAVVVSLGVDAFEGDPISFFRLASDDFTSVGRRIGALGIPTVYVMEGGYAVDEIGTNVVNVLVGHQSA